MSRPVTAVVATAVALLAAACTTAGESADRAAAGPAAPPPTAEEAADLDLDALLAEAATIPLAGSDAAPPPVVPARAAGTAGYSRYVFREFEGRVLTSLVEGPRGRQARCQDVDAPCSYDDLVVLAASGEAPPPGLGLDADGLRTLVGELTAVRDALAPYADVGRACADGFTSDRTQTPNMGSHFTNLDRVFDGRFELTEPEILIYVAAGGGPPERTYGQCVAGAWVGGPVTLAAASYIVLTGQVGDDHPAGFTGDFDNWHVHHNLCRGEGVDTIVPEDECVRRGGTWHDTLGWMIHAWVAPGFDNQLGVFSMWNPVIWPSVAGPDGILERQQSRPSDLPDGAVVETVTNFAFGDVIVPAGGTVVWANADTVPHTVTAGSHARPLLTFDSGVVAPGDAARVRFDDPGEFAFFCALHPDMTASVTVTR